MQRCTGMTMAASAAVAMSWIAFDDVNVAAERPRDGCASDARRPHFPGRSALAAAAAEPLDSRLGHRRRGRRARSRLDRASRRRVADGADRKWSRHRPADRRDLLPAGAAGARVRSRRASSSAAGADRVKATTGPSLRAASPSMRKGRSGSPRQDFLTQPRAAAAAGEARKPRRRRPRRGRSTRTSSSSRATASSCCRSASRADRGEREQDGAQSPGRARGRCRGERGLRRRRPRQPPHRRVRRHDRRLQAALGRLRRRARRCDARRVQSGGAAGEAVPDGQLRDDCAGRHWSTSAIGRTTASRCSRRTASSSRKRSCRRGRSANGAVWDIAFSADSAQRYLFVADGQDQKIFILRARHARRAGELRRRRPVARTVLRRRQRRRRLAGQRLHGRDVRGQARAEVRARR